MLSTGPYLLRFLCPGSEDATGIAIPASSQRDHEHFLRQVQRLRGQCYVADGAIPALAVGEDQRHEQPDDRIAWHAFLTSESRDVVGCVRMLMHPPGSRYEEFRLSNAPIAQHVRWGPLVRRCIEQDLTALAARNEYAAELGGWAIAPEHRRTRAALHLLTAVGALGRAIGDCICYGTATARHGSLAILRRLGGAPVRYGADSVPDYFDPHFDCEMGLVRFPSMWSDVPHEKNIRAITSSFRPVPQRHVA